MDPFPIELWRLIVQKLRRPDWLVLSTICRFFHIIAQAQLYEEVNLLEYSPRYGEEKASIKKFSGLLAERPELGGLVRKLSLGLVEGVSSPLHRHPVFACFKFFTELRVLELTNFEMDTSFYTPGTYPPQLTTLRLTDCCLPDQYTLFGNLKAISPPPGAMRFSENSNEDQAAFVTTRLQSLHIRTSNRMGETPEFLEKLLWKFILHGVGRSLTTISIEQVILPPNIVPFLESAPLLLQLWLPRVRPDSEHSIHTLNGDAIPLLEHFSGPAEYCRLFLTGRPVHSVGVALSENSSVDILLSLAVSSIPLTRMKLRFASNRPNKEIEVSILHHAPATLCHLSWTDSVSKTRVLSWIPALSRLSSLETIRGRVHSGPEDDPLEPPDQKALLLTIYNICPSMRGFTFPWIDDDIDRWSRWSDGHWERYVEN